MAEIKLQTGEMAFIDDEDLRDASGYQWRCNAAGYVFATIGGKIALMHRWLTGCPTGLEVHHINQDKLDNRKANLEKLTRSEHAHFDHAAKTRRPRKRQGVKKYAPSLPVDVMTGMQELARRHRRSVNAEVAWALEKYVEREAPELAAAQAGRRAEEATGGARAKADRGADGSGN